MSEKPKLFTNFTPLSQPLLPLPSLQPYQADERPLAGARLDQLLAEESVAASGWQLDESGRVICRRYALRSYLLGLNFVAYLGAAAEAIDHHPDLTLSYGELIVSWSSHCIKGLHRNDIDMAKYSDDLFNALVSKEKL